MERMMEDAVGLIIIIINIIIIIFISMVWLVWCMHASFGGNVELCKLLIIKLDL